MNYDFKIKHVYKTSPQMLQKAFKRVNEKMVTFGVHSDTNNQHSMRDMLQNKPLHKALYADGGKIQSKGNAQILKENTYGFSTTFYVGGEPMAIEVPPRPVLQPITANWFTSELFKRQVKAALHLQLNYPTIDYFSQSLQYIANKLNRNRVIRFLQNRGEGNWDPSARHNNPYVAAVKFFDKLDESGLGGIYNDKYQFIKYMQNWNTSQNFSSGDRPLMDSLDLINSIDARIEDVKEKK